MLNQSHFLNIIPANRRKMNSNKNGKSPSKDSNSKGLVDPNSKNPAAGGQARSLSSPYSPAVGNVARGGQEPQPAPFVTAIVSCITKSAKEHNVPVNFHDVVAFATNYASRMPGKLRKFEQSDVEEALTVFQEEYVPPQPQAQPQPQPQPQQRLPYNRDNLFGQMLFQGNKHGIPRDELIAYLKWWTSLPGIREIAENPAPADVEDGIQQMLLAISPGAKIIDLVIEKGISRETIGDEALSKLTAMMRSHQPGLMWAFKECPPLSVLQREMCKAPYTCILAGISFSPDGKHTVFKQKLVNPGYAPVPDPNFMVGGPAIVFIAKVGLFQYIDQRSIADVIIEKVPSSDRLGNATYDSSGNYVVGSKHQGQLQDAGKKSRKEEKFKNLKFLVPDLKGNLPRDDPTIRADADYQAACNEAMAGFVGIPVTVCASVDAQVVAENSDHCSQEAVTTSWGAAAP